MAEHERMTQGGGTEKETETRREVSETTRTTESVEPDEGTAGGSEPDEEQSESTHGR